MSGYDSDKATFIKHAQQTVDRPYDHPMERTSPNDVDAEPQETMFPKNIPAQYKSQAKLTCIFFRNIVWLAHFHQ